MSSSRIPWCKPVLALFAVCLTGLFASAFPAITPLPFAIFHGLGDQCSNAGMSQFTQMLATEGQTQGQCIEIGSGAEDSWLMPLTRQVDLACKNISSSPLFANGLNLIGLSQGAVIARALVETCDSLPPVRNLVSFGGPHAGVASFPNCKILGSMLYCRLIDLVIRIGVYSKWAQSNIGPAGYVKIPTQEKEYLKGCTFLPRINNEQLHKEPSVKQRFARLNRLALVMFSDDQMMVPKETAHFRFFLPRSFDIVPPLTMSPLYLEDWIGLKSLMDEGRVDFLEFTGGHLHITRDNVRQNVLPYINGQL